MNTYELNLPHELLLPEYNPVIQDTSSPYDEPLVKFVDNIIEHAANRFVSDIHIEPFEKICRIRYRRDGMLSEVTQVPLALAARLITRLKILASLDIAERRLPQDGRIAWNHRDIRISTCPTLYGEKMVLRLLNSNANLYAINQLGLSEIQEKIFLEKLSGSKGLILVTGPTGSGKTVTLYAALNHLNQPERNISTVEDPVEIQLTGINQINVNAKIGLEFTNILRSVLRQDPDVIMIGEIRDRDTAEIAIQAAQTGHLVLTTLHTNNALETLSRLSGMGIAKHHLASSLSLIIAQRLIRKLCPACKLIEIPTYTYQPGNCNQCVNGFNGRIGIYEFLAITPEIIPLILQNNFIELSNHLKKNYHRTLFDAGIEYVNQGITSLSEINRVI